MELSYQIVFDKFIVDDDAPFDHDFTQVAEKPYRLFLRDFFFAFLENRLTIAALAAAILDLISFLALVKELLYDRPCFFTFLSAERNLVRADFSFLRATDNCFFSRFISDFGFVIYTSPW